MTFDESVEIAAEPAALFCLSQDYSRRLEWDPFLRSAQLVGAAREAGLGVRALCVLAGDGPWKPNMSRSTRRAPPPSR
jgi:hypothetical protein